MTGWRQSTLAKGPQGVRYGIGLVHSWILRTQYRKGYKIKRRVVRASFCVIVETNCILVMQIYVGELLINGKLKNGFNNKSPSLRQVIT